LSMEYDHTKEMAPGVFLRWSVVGEEIMLCLQAKATGWVGFGLAEVGGMKGSDIVYYEAKSNKLTDSYAVENGMPRADACSQDWKLRSAENVDGTMTVEMSRLLVVTDTEDRNFEDDAALPMAPTAVIMAWGDDDNLSYHAQSRAKAQVRFFQQGAGGGGVSMQERIDALKADSTIQKVEMLQSDHPIPDDRSTQYHEECYILKDIMPAGSEAGEFHIVGFEPFLDPRTKKHIHHYVVSAGNDCENSEGMTVVWLWGPGIPGYVFPPEAGVRIMTGGFQAIHIQIHYDNPTLISGLVDSSGFSIFYTNQLRQFDAGILQLGDPNILLFKQPIKEKDGSGYSHLTLTNPARDCTGKWEVDEVTVFERFMHMHKAGERMVTRQYRDGELVRTDFCDYYDFFQSGGFSPRSTAAGFKIKKGDTFDVECFYYSNDKMIRFGLASDDEMCIDFLYYYPLQKNSVCNPSLDTLQPPEDLASIGDLGRKFGSCEGGASSLLPAWGLSLAALAFAIVRAARPF